MTTIFSHLLTGAVNFQRILYTAGKPEAPQNRSDNPD